MPSTFFSSSDTIVAIATPPGRGALGVIRLSGPDAHRIAGTLLGRSTPLEPRRATFARIRRSRSIDQVVATFFPGPASYTGQDLVELGAHGSPIVLRQIIDAAVAAGARLAEPGEFTLRAFLNGKIDLVQAEAVADLIDSVTPLQARAAFDQLEGTLTDAISAIDARLFDVIARLEASLDFPDEGYHFVDPGDLVRELDRILADTRALLRRAETGRLIREGLQVVIVGKPNVGKSTLFNTLAGAARAIVTAQPGTTRDLLTETIDLDGLKMTLVDTAGIRETHNEVEREGVLRARRAQDVADARILVLDGSEPLDAEDVAILLNDQNSRDLCVVNKVDVGSAWRAADVPALLGRPVVMMSLRTGEGVDALKPALLQALGVEAPERDPVRVTNARHIGLLTDCIESLARARAAVDMSGGAIPEEFVLDDLHDAREKLEQVRGRRAPDAVLQEIFSRFCIGK
ncbi:MAG TPA: tRNA uridine-5-carboxymethylaminomethyl(34) synthesis GTPase MnmE [Vicinamibacterales bacterium]|jgi:tRNA modification GTPase